MKLIWKSQKIMGTNSSYDKAIINKDLFVKVCLVSLTPKVILGYKALFYQKTDKPFFKFLGSSGEYYFTVEEAKVKAEELADFFVNLVKKEALGCGVKGAYIDEALY